MTTTTKTKDQKTIRNEQIEKDVARVNELIKQYDDFAKKITVENDQHNNELMPFTLEFSAKTSHLVSAFDNRVKPLKESLESAKKEMLEIADRYKETDKFDINGHWPLEEDYYLFLSKETKAITGLDKAGNEFSLTKFFKKFPDYLNIKFNIKLLSDAFKDTKTRGKILATGLDLKIDKTVELKQKAESKKKVD